MKPQPSAKKPSPVRAVALLGLLTALCTVLRIVKVPIPNVQPVTDILMIVTLLLGFRWGFSLTMSTLIVSNLFLGFGLWTLPQIVAYACCMVIVIVMVTIRLHCQFRHGGDWQFEWSRLLGVLCEWVTV